LIRIARSPAGEVLLDERGKLPGRGAYLCARRECLDKARKTRALARALKTEIPDELYTRLGEYIDSYWGKFSAAELRLKELRSLLGLSRRAGLAYIGMDSVKSQCAKAEENTKHTKHTKNAKTKKSLLILTASDCSESVKDFARRQAEKSGAQEDGAQWLGVPLNIVEISAALGTNNVQILALPVRSGLTDRIRALLFENCERPGEAGESEEAKEAENGRLISLPEGGVALEQNESV
jgi:predicted RNA-binding protein YlxR (DUF448 family)